MKKEMLKLRKPKMAGPLEHMKSAKPGMSAEPVKAGQGNKRTRVPTDRYK